MVLCSVENYSVSTIFIRDVFSRVVFNTAMFNFFTKQYLIFHISNFFKPKTMAHILNYLRKGRSNSINPPI
jgi:hypothetical protein